MIAIDSTGHQALLPPPETHRTRRTIIWLAIILLILVAAFFGWRIFRPAAAPARPPAPLSVSTATAAKGDIPIILDALGTVTPLATVTVRSRIAGQLTQIAFQEGQVVNQGDFLAQIDPRPYQAALDQMQGQLVHDQALLKEAQADLARYRKLAAENSIARQQADNQEFVVEQDQGTVKADQGQVENAQLNLEYCRITAPVGGVVGLRQVDQGNYVQTSDANGIVVITQIKPISVVFALPEDNLPQVLKQLRAGQGLPVTALDRSAANTLGTGTLLSTDNQIDTTTGTAKMRAQFPNADGALFPNQFVNVRLLVDTVKDATTVPVAAIQRGGPGTYVYLVKPDNSVAITVVKLGPATSDTQSIQSGLNVGDQVVVDGADKLKDGSKVAVRPATGTASATTPGKPPTGKSSGSQSSGAKSSDMTAPLASDGTTP